MKKQKKRPQVIHRSKLFGGIKTAMEVHAESAWGRCTIAGCMHLPVIQIKCFMMLKDFTEKAPDLATAIAMSNPDGPFIPTVPMTFGPMVRFSTVNACKAHQADAERAAAKAPSWVLVEIDRGPGADRPIVQVAEAT